MNKEKPKHSGVVTRAETFICRDCQVEQPLEHHWSEDDCETCSGEGVLITGDICPMCDQGVTRSCEDCSRPTRVVLDYDEDGGPYEREVFA